MKKSFLKRLGFTLIELLVVISIIGILASLAIPAVSGALTKGQQTGTLNNARQLQLANFNLNLERETIGQEGAWPGDSNTVSTSFTLWVEELTNALNENDLKKMFSAPRVAVTDFPPSGASAIAFNVYKVGDVEDNTSIFLSTRNWDATDATTAPSGNPYADKGVIIMRKGGDGAVVQSRFVTNTNTTSVPTDQPAKLE